MSAPPRTPLLATNLAELSVFSREEVERALRSPGLERAALGAEGFRALAAWRARRSMRSSTADEVGAAVSVPTPGGVAFPLVAAGPTRACGLGWVDAVLLADAGPPGVAVDEGVTYGFEVARRWLSFRSLGDGARIARVTAPSRFHGGSAALAALVAHVARGVGFTIPDDLAATGCLGFDENQEARILPVDVDTIRGKVEVLRDHGFRRILIPEEQESQFDAYIDPADGMQLVALPSSASASLPKILEVLLGSGEEEEGALLSALLMIDKVCVRDPGRLDEDFPRALLRAIRRGGGPIVRVVVADLRARSAVHDGRPGAERLDRYVEAMMARHELVVADPWLADYFDAHQMASRAMLALDTGDWNQGDGSLAWGRLDEEIGELTRRSIRRQGRFLNLRDEYALFACRNTRAYLRVFLGRLLGDADRVREGLNDRVEHRAHWEHLVRYGFHSLGHRGATMARQWNQVADAMSSLIELGGLDEGSPAVLAATEVLQAAWPVGLPFPEPGDACGEDFTTCSRLRWMRLTRQPGWERAAEEWLEVFERATKPEVPWVFAQHLPAEQVAAYHPDASVRLRAAAILDRPWAIQYEDPKSILWVLRFRALAASGLARGDDVMPSLQSRVEPFADTPLGRIAARMIAGSAEDVLIRCPY